jgi:ribosomal-protein-alanine N-acetyltransferase
MRSKTKVLVRPATPSDLPRVAEIEMICFPSQPWGIEDLGKYDTLIAAAGQRIVGFLSFRVLVLPHENVLGEFEILNLAVDPAYRRQGIAKSLLTHHLAKLGEHFLEVRESNIGALKLYQSLGFRAVGTRGDYYTNPNENAIVMKLKWC